MSERVTMSVKVEKHLREAAKRNSEHGEISEEFRKTIQRIAYGEEIEQEERLKVELREKRNERDELKGEIREKQAEVETLETEIARLEERVENRNERRDKFEGMVEMLEATLKDGGRVFPEHGQVKQAAAVGEVEPEDVIERLKERNPDAPDHAFVPVPEDSTPFHGL